MQFSEPGIIQALRPCGYAGAVNLRKRRSWFEGDPAPTPPAPVPTPTPAPTPSGTGTPPVNNGGEPEKVTMTTAQLAARLDTETNKALSRLFETLGVKDATELGDILKKQREADEAQLSAVEKAEKRAADLEAKLRAAEEQAAQVVKDAQIKERNGAVKAALNGAKDASDLMILIEARMADDLAKVLKDDGTLDDKAVKELADKAKKQWPEQFKPAGPGSPSHSGGHNMDDSQLDKKARDQAFRQRRRSI